MKQKPTKRSGQQWRDLFEAQASSGLSQAQFCRDNGLCPKHFSLRRKQLGFATQSVSSFVEVTMPKPTQQAASVRLQYQGLELVFDNVESSQIIMIAKGLL